MALTKEEQLELEALKKELGSTQSQATVGLTPEEEAELNQLKQELQPQDEKSLGGKALDYGLRALDYADGLTRTGVAELADIGVDGNKVTGEDWKNTLVGKAPDTATYMQKLGVPEGENYDLNPFMEGTSSARDIGGFVGDVILSPANLATLGSASLAKKGLLKSAKVLDVAANPAGKLLEKVGRSTYKSGLKNVDELLSKKGQRALSEVLLENGAPIGSNKKLLAKVKEMSNQLAPKRDKLFSEARDLGVKVDPHFSMNEAREKLLEMRKDPGLRDLADDLEAKIANYANEGRVDLDVASNWKTNLYDALPEKTFDVNGKIKKPAQKVVKAQARGLKNEIESAANFAREGLGDEVGKLNNTWGSLIASKPILENEAKKAARKNAFTSVDSILTGMSWANPTLGLPTLALKKSVELANSTAGRTAIGKGSMKLGKSKAVDPVVRRSIYDLLNDKDKNQSE